MSDQVVVDLFVEDRAHEELLKPLLTRIAQEEHIEMWVRVRSATGGHGRAIAEFKLYQRVVERSPLSNVPADLVVVAIDGNCSTFADARRRIQDVADPMLRDRLVVACPDPHVERWYVADPQSFEAIVGHRPIVGSKKCVRGYYKKVLTTAIRQAGHPVTLGGVEFASELVEGMDLYRAGRNDSSLKAFLDDFRTKLRRDVTK
jgi:hypothetical protein